MHLLESSIKALRNESALSSVPHSIIGLGVANGKPDLSSNVMVDSSVLQLGPLVMLHALGNLSGAFSWPQQLPTIVFFLRPDQ